MKIRSLEESIIFTVCYFDVFDYPMTSFEVWRFLFNFQANLERVMRTLDELIRQGKIEMKNGFYFLPERSDLLDRRQDKYDISEKFWRRALFAAKILTYLPFIQMVSVVNSLSFFNCDKSSDIDFFIVTEKGKIWTARAISSLVLHLLGMRRYGKRVAKRICLSFYISDEKMNLEYIAHDNLGFFVAFWISQLAPIFSENNTYNKFYKENNWIKKYLPNTNKHITDYYINFRAPIGSKLTKKILELLLKYKIFEDLARKIQLQKMLSTQKKFGDPSSVLFNDFILKFHPIDLRVGYKEELTKRLKKYLDF